jgi:hypothetical protein
MKRTQLIVGLTCLALSIVIFILADGLRRYYSGGFFLLLAVVFLVNARWGTAARGDAQEE